jgi:hypothetical protein
MIPIHTPHLKPSIFTNTMWAALPCSPTGSCCTRPTGCLAVSPRRARALAGSLARSPPCPPACSPPCLHARARSCALVAAPAMSAAEPACSRRPHPRPPPSPRWPHPRPAPVAMLAEPHRCLASSPSPRWLSLATASAPSSRWPSTRASRAWHGRPRPSSPCCRREMGVGGRREERGGREADSGPALHVKHASAPPLASLCTGGGLGAPDENLHASALKFHLGGLCGSIFLS